MSCVRGCDGVRCAGGEAVIGRREDFGWGGLDNVAIRGHSGTIPLYQGARFPYLTTRVTQTYYSLDGGYVQWLKASPRPRCGRGCIPQEAQQAWAASQVRACPRGSQHGSGRGRGGASPPSSPFLPLSPPSSPFLPFLAPQHNGGLGGVQYDRTSALTTSMGSEAHAHSRLSSSHLLA